MKKIIFTAFHPGGANSLVPVIKHILNENKVELLVIGHKFSKKVFQSAGIKYQTIDKYELPDVTVDSMRVLINIESPDLIVTGTSVQNNENRIIIEHSLIVAAREEKIKTLSILDVWGCYLKKFSNLFPVQKFNFLPDKIAVMDKRAKSDMVAKGFNEDILVITGNPYFDDFAQMKNSFNESQKNRIRADLGISQNSFVILYASQPIESQFKNSLGYTEKVVLKDILHSLSTLCNANFTLLIKVHPRQDLKYFEGLEEFNFPIVIDREYPTTQTVMASDLIVSSFSTVLIESNYLEKTSFSYQPNFKGEDITNTNELGMTIPIYNQTRLHRLLQLALSNLSSLDKEVTRVEADGKATHRVVQQIYQMLQED